MSDGEALALDARWRKICSETLSLVTKNKDAWIFKDPVIESPELTHEAKIAYSALIPDPMDFRTIRKNIAAFSSPLEFETDMMLVFSNCAVFNKPGQDAFEMGKDVEHVFLTRWQLERRKDIAVSLWQQSELLAGDSDILISSRRKAKSSPPFYDEMNRKVVQYPESAGSSGSGDFDWREVLRAMLTKLQADPGMVWFLRPVHMYPSIDAGVKKQYYQLIRTPMDFDTISKNIDVYPNPNECRRDLELIVTNSVRFNPPGTVVNTAALALQAVVTHTFDVVNKAEFGRLATSLPTEWKGAKRVMPDPPPADLTPHAPPPTVLRLKRAKTATGDDGSATPGEPVPPVPTAPPALPVPVKQTSQPAVPKPQPSVLLIDREMTSLPPPNQHWSVYALHCLSELNQIKDDNGGASNRLNWIFQKPIYKYELPVHIKRLYLLSVANLIDLSIIHAKLAGGVYAGPAEFEHDVTLMLDNCLVFNDETQFPHKVGFVLKKHFQRYWFSQLKPLASPNAAMPGLPVPVPPPADRPHWQEIQQQVASETVRPNMDCDSVSATFPLNEELLYEWRVSQRYVMQQFRSL